MTELLTWFIVTGVLSMGESQILEVDVKTEFEMADDKADVLTNALNIISGLVGIHPQQRETPEKKPAEKEKEEKPEKDIVDIIILSHETKKLQERLEQNKTLTQKEKETMLIDFSRRQRFGLFLVDMASVLLKHGSGAQRLFAETLENMQLSEEDDNQSGTEMISDIINHIRRTASITLQAPEKIVQMTLVHFVTNLHNRSDTFEPRLDQLLYSISDMYTTPELQDMEMIATDFAVALKSYRLVVEDLKKAMFVKPFQRMSHANQTRFINGFTRLVDEAYIATLKNPFGSEEDERRRRWRPSRTKRRYKKF